MITIHNGESSKLTQWMVKTSNTKTSLKLMGENPMDSERVETGLTNCSAESLVEHAKKSHSAKSFGPAKQRGEERRWITQNWKNWPEKITISTIKDDSEEVSHLCGEYIRAKFRQTINQSAMWIMLLIPRITH